MSKIQGVTCEIFNESPERTGRCDFDELHYECDYLWTTMNHMDIEIDGMTYVVPSDR